MNIAIKIATGFLCATVAASCTKAPEETEPGSELDWSQTSTITVGSVAMASSTKASSAMGVNETFRLYALNSKTKAIIATQTYTIKTTAGVPVADDGNEEIVLPYGPVEIFLVGPVKATVDAVEHEIATPVEVKPVLGVDLVSSRTEVVIKTRRTEINPNPLQHKMVKLEVAVQMEQDGVPDAADRASYVDAYMTDVKHGVSIENVSTYGTFAFDDQGGTVSGTAGSSCRYLYTAGNSGERNLKQTTAGVTVPEGNVGSAYSAYDYVFPTAATQAKLTITYGYTFRAGETVPAHEMSGKTPSKQAWVGGTYVKLSTTPTPSIVMTLRADILPWDEGGTTPVAPPSNNDLLFWYSGEDKPEVIDSRLCWRDRSGNGNHAVIEGTMEYDPVNKCYITTNGSYFRLPALGAVPEYTLEFVSQSTAVAKSAAADFNGYHGILLNLPYDTHLVWYNSISNDWGEHTAYGYGENDKYIYEQLSSYAFCRNQTTAAIVINGVEKKVEAKAGPWLDFNDNRLWVSDAGYMDKTYKLYGVRMYKKYMNDATGRSTLAANHAAKLSQQGVTAPLSGATFDYVKDGLIVDLRGETAPSGSDPNRVWPDLSGRGNSPTLDAGVARQYGLSGTIYYGGSSDADRMRFTKPLGTYKELTIEVVTELTRESLTNPLIQFQPDNTGYLRSGIYWCYPGVGYIFEAPSILNNAQRVAIPIDKLKYTQTTLSQLSCYRQGDKLYAAQNGYVYSDFAGNAPSDKVSQLVNGLIYANYQHIYAVRIYNRALSDFERQHNYLVDKAKYKILP